ncbi:YwiC-like family protein [Corynebacterium sp. TAE3-ERU12]|uniref:YwiC-like family protein n=1 Tax=Corynebacterium sp. TAE3-ERU12 TaxID=2849491 RepID=UPI001C466057|nr:YwiC-like family protein [Corynebacterium sp. TAE3-ERU12]MBV7295675.1 YwiC-like family protein [Corynebacterium sp. TAE3-ERU12]
MPSHNKQATRKKRRSKGWVPDQHGAWAMVTLPPITALFFAQAWVQVPLLLTWWFGYFAFFAASIWMRSRFREINRTPVLVYGTATAFFGIATLLMKWQLLIWALPYAPLVAIAVYETYRRRPRSLASGWSTVIAAVLMFPVTLWAADYPLNTEVWTVTAIIGVYFLSTVPYVKTLIRERGNKNWLLFSIAFHAAAVLAAVVAAGMGLMNWGVPVVAAAVLAKAWWMPHENTKRDRPWQPKVVGKLEMVFTVLVWIVAMVVLV